MATTAKPMTTDDYYAITVEGDRKQLVEGAIVVNEPKLIHGVLQVRLLRAIGNWIEEGENRGLVVPPTDVVLDRHNVYGPDVNWIAEEHRPADLDRYPERVPDICAEIRSPGTWRYDVGAKKTVYEKRGLPELWLVDDVSATVLVYRRSSPDSPTFEVALELTRGDSLTSPQLQGFSLPLEKLFRD